MSGRSQAATRIESGAAVVEGGGDGAGTAHRPGHRRATTSRPIAPRARRSPPWHTTPLTATARAGRRRPVATIGDAVDLDQRLVAPHPRAGSPRQHDADHDPDLSRWASASGMPAGSSWSRNCVQRSASSVSPMAAAIAASPQQAAQEPGVARRRPTHVARAAPSIGAQGVEAAVVADAIGGVALDHVAAVIAERRPAVEQPWFGGNHLGDRRTRVVGPERLGERVPRTGVRLGQDGRGQSRREIDRLGRVAHAVTIGRTVRVTSVLGASRTTAELVTLTAAKTVSNTALRWVGPFLPTLERAFGATTGNAHRHHGRRRAGRARHAWRPDPSSTVATSERRRPPAWGWSSLSSVIALGGSVTTFADLVRAARHRRRQPHRRRARLDRPPRSVLGAQPGDRVLRDVVGGGAARRRADPVAADRVVRLARAVRGAGDRRRAVASSSCWLASARASPTPPRRGPVAQRELPPGSAYLPMLASASTAASGIGMFVISGTWLDDSHGVSTGGLGLVAAGFGSRRAGGVGSSRTVADRIGSRRSVVGGLLVLG